MAAREQRKFVEKMEAFSTSLEEIVGLLKDDAESKKTDVMGDFIKGLSDNIVQIAEDLKAAREDIKSVRADTEYIRKSIDDLKASKETGMFGEVSNAKNKDKIIDGLKIIGLIAIGVLAIGIAFKIVGDVDFMSVISLSLAILAISYAYAQVAEMKLDWKKALAVTGMLVIMSVGITTSSWILKMVAPLNLFQMVTIVAIGVTMGITLYFLTKAVDSLKATSLAKLALLPLAMPAIAMAIVLTSLILKAVAPITMAQGLTALVIAGVIALSIYAIKPLMKMEFKPSEIKNLLLLPLLIPAVMGAIVISSWLMKGMADVKLSTAISVGIIGIAIGLAVLSFAPTIKILSKIDKSDIIKGIASAIAVAGVVILVALMFSAAGKMGLDFKNVPYPPLMWTIGVGLSLITFAFAVKILSKLQPKEMLMGALAVLIVSTTIMASSWILSIGNYKDYPKLGWAAGVGLSMVAFGISALALGVIMFATGGMGFAILAMGAGAILMVAGTIVATSYILSEGKYGSYPSFGWASGVGLSMIGFGVSALFLGAILATGLGIVVLYLGVKAIKYMAQAIVDVAEILGKGTYGNYPSKDWAKGVGNALFNFGMISLMMPKKGAGKIEDMADAITSVANKFSKADFSIYPSREWVEGFTGAIIPMLMASRALSAFSSAMKDIDKLGKLNIDKTLIKLGNSMMYLAVSLRMFSKSSGQNLKHLNNMANSMMLLSLIDKAKLNDVLNTLDEKGSKLKRVSEDSGSLMEFLQKAIASPVQTSQVVAGATNITKQEKAGEKVKTYEEQLLSHIAKIDNNISEMLKLEKAKTDPNASAQAGEDIRK